MILEPDDILQKGDTVHYSTGGTHIVWGGLIGKNVLDLKLSGSWFIERPDPVISDAEKIRILREALEETRDLARTGLAPDSYNMTQEQWMSHKLNEIAGNLNAVLEATK